MNNIFNLKETRLNIPFEFGTIETLINGVASPRINNNKQDLAIIAHPHPLGGGNMDNKVVFTICRSFWQKNIPTIRFNMRGVGKTNGEYDKGIGETQDLLTIVSYIKYNYLNEFNLYLAGFSFGSFIVFNSLGEFLNDKNHELKQSFLVAPAICHSNFEIHSYLQNANLHFLVPTQDEIVDSQATLKFNKQLNDQKINTKLVEFPNTQHFFHKKLIDLKNTMLDLIN